MARIGDIFETVAARRGEALRYFKRAERVHGVKFGNIERDRDRQIKQPAGHIHHGLKVFSAKVIM